ncbi:hypothetical protein ACFL4G_08020 [Thermodesulfobacteriota bacterium]
MNSLVELQELGFTFWLDGDHIQYHYERPGDPDPSLIRPLLADIRCNKDKAIRYLQTQDDPFEYLFQKALDDLRSQYIEGAFPYVVKHCPDLYQKIVSAEHELNRLWIAGRNGEDVIRAFREILTKWYDLRLEGIRFFQRNKTASK